MKHYYLQQSAASESSTSKRHFHEPKHISAVKQSSTELFSLVTKLQEENKMLRDKNLLLQRISAEQDEFLLMVAHNLKNPLTTITMGTSFLQQRWRDLSLQDVYTKQTLLHE
jgi:signal transduction histidine kinase